MTTPKPLLKALEARDGRRSAWTGNESDTLVPQHRVGGMGGSRFKHRLSNVVWLESRINGLIEDDAVWADEARRRGFKVSQHEKSTEHVPIDHAVHGRCLLLDDGQVITGPEVF